MKQVLLVPKYCSKELTAIFDRYRGKLTVSCNCPLEISIHERVEGAESG